MLLPHFCKTHFRVSLGQQQLFLESKENTTDEWMAAIKAAVERARDAELDTHAETLLFSSDSEGETLLTGDKESLREKQLESIAQSANALTPRSQSIPPEVPKRADCVERPVATPDVEGCHRATTPRSGVDVGTQTDVFAVVGRSRRLLLLALPTLVFAALFGFMATIAAAVLALISATASRHLAKNRAEIAGTDDTFFPRSANVVLAQAPNTSASESSVVADIEQSTNNPDSRSSIAPVIKDANSTPVTHAGSGPNNELPRLKRFGKLAVGASSHPCILRTLADIHAQTCTQRTICAQIRFVPDTPHLRPKGESFVLNDDSNPLEFETPWFKGRTVVRIKGAEGAMETNYFDGKKRLFSFQVGPDVNSEQSQLFTSLHESY